MAPEGPKTKERLEKEVGSNTVNELSSPSSSRSKVQPSDTTEHTASVTQPAAAMTDPGNETIKGETLGTLEQTATKDTAGTIDGVDKGDGDEGTVCRTETSSTVQVNSSPDCQKEGCDVVVNGQGTQVNESNDTKAIHKKSNQGSSNQNLCVESNPSGPKEELACSNDDSTPPVVPVSQSQHGNILTQESTNKNNTKLRTPSSSSSSSIKSDTGGANESGSDEAATPTNCSGGDGKDNKSASPASDNNGSHSSNNNDNNEKDLAGEEKEELWVMTHVMTLEELHKDPVGLCSTDKCKTPAAVIYKCISHPEYAEYHECLDCQKSEFGGWPELENIPIETMTSDHAKLLRSKCSKSGRAKIPKFPEPVETPDEEMAELQTPNENKQKEEPVPEPEEEGDQWDLVRVMSIEDMKAPILCAECSLPAAVVYRSSDPAEKDWYGCLDCQAEHFDGWPSVEEIPLSFMSPEHSRVLRMKCSKFKDAVMPDYPLTMVASPSVAQTTKSHTITPVPQQGGKSTSTAGASASANGPNGVTPLETKPKTKLEKKVAMDKKAKFYRQWQEEAAKLGGSSIIVSHDEAKKVIFDLLYDAFKPLNITQIYEALKGEVPKAVLKSCLLDMALSTGGETLFADSDDDNDEEKKMEETKKDPYSNSLCVKDGKNANSALYYLDYSKTQNNGNGLPSEEKNALWNKLAQARQEKAAVLAAIQNTQATTTKLLSEPTNAEAAALLQTSELDFASLQQQVEEARGYQANEKDVTRLNKRKHHMLAEWRKRKRICCDFLNSMEDATDGTVSAAKCLKGDGQIEIDGDEATATAALSFAKNKAKKAVALKKASKKGGKQSAKQSLGDPAFVAVKLDSQGLIVRVYADSPEE